MDVKFQLDQLQKNAGMEIAEKAAFLWQLCALHRDGIVPKEKFGVELDSMLNWNVFEILEKNHIAGKPPTQEEWQQLIEIAKHAYHNGI